MNLKRLGILIIIASVVFTVYFIDNRDFIVLGLTLIIFGFLISLIGFLADVRKQKEINDRLEKDIPKIIQPLVTKYSKLNKEFIESLDEEDYLKKRFEMNKDLEKEFTENLPYLSKSDIKKMVIEFNRDQKDK